MTSSAANPRPQRSKSRRTSSNAKKNCELKWNAESSWNPKGFRIWSEVEWTKHQWSRKPSLLRAVLLSIRGPQNKTVAWEKFVQQYYFQTPPHQLISFQTHFPKQTREKNRKKCSNKYAIYSSNFSFMYILNVCTTRSYFSLKFFHHLQLVDNFPLSIFSPFGILKILTISDCDGNLN